MAVNLSPIGGVAAQFLDNSGNPLSGGKIFTYAAGTTTPQSSYTSSNGATPHSNPIILDAAGRVPSGEIWLTDGFQYKFLIKTSTDTQIGSYDNIIGINSNFVNYTNSQEFQTATAGQTVFTLTTMAYQPGTNSLSVFVDGVNQYGPGAMYAFQETSDTVVTFNSGLHVGAEVKFTTSAINASSYGDAQQISYTPPFTGSLPTNVEAKLAQTVSVKDFGAVGDGVTDDTAAIQAAADAVGRGGTILFPQTTDNTYCVSSALKFYAGQTWVGSGGIDVSGGFGTEIKLTAASTSVVEPADPAPSAVTYGFTAQGFYFNAQGFADCALSLYNTSYALIDQCAATVTKAGAAAILLDSDTVKQCYFNKINQPRTFATGTGSVGVRFARGANANQVFGGKCGSSESGMEFITLSAGNLVIGTDFENNVTRHVYVDAPQNAFIGVHMESCPVGFELTANSLETVRIGTSYATTVTTQVSEPTVLDGAVLDMRKQSGSAQGDLRFGGANYLATKVTGGTTLDYNPILVTGTSNAIINLFRNITTTGSRQWNLYKGDGTSTVTVQFNAATGAVVYNDLLQGNETGSTYRRMVRRAAAPTTGTWAVGDIALATSPTAGGFIGWVCTTAGTPGTWKTFGVISP